MATLLGTYCWSWVGPSCAFRAAFDLSRKASTRGCNNVLNNPREIVQDNPVKSSVNKDRRFKIRDVR